MNYRISIASDVGLVRTNNEDAVAASGGPDDASPACWQSEQRNSCWVAVADGIGGSPAGEVASELAVRMFAGIADRLGTPADIEAAIAAIDRELRSVPDSLAGTRGMGTTLAAMLLRGNDCMAVNLGDSRIYLQRGSRLVQLSIDHADRHYLTGYIGGHAATEEKPAISIHHLVTGDTLLLCTDGLTNMVGDEQISRILTDSSDNPAHTLVGAALDAGGVDNVTVAVIRCEQEGVQ